MGAYTACLDLTRGIFGVLLGLTAKRAGFSYASLVRAIRVVCVIPIAVRLKAGVTLCCATPRLSAGFGKIRNSIGRECQEPTTLLLKKPRLKILVADIVIGLGAMAEL